MEYYIHLFMSYKKVPRAYDSIKPALSRIVYGWF